MHIKEDLKSLDKEKLMCLIYNESLSAKSISRLYKYSLIAITSRVKKFNLGGRYNGN